MAQYGKPIKIDYKEPVFESDITEKISELKRLVKEKQEKEYELDNLTQQGWFNGSFETDVEYSVIINVINDRIERIDKLILEL